MKLKECTELFYSIYLYKYQEYDCFKYNFKLPGTYSRTIQNFFERNKFNIQELSRYTKPDIILKSILSVFIYNKGNIVHLCTEHQYTKFKDEVQYYQNEFDLFIDIFDVNFGYRDIYFLYTQKKITFFIFYYFLKYVRLEEGFSDKELIKNKFIEVHKLMKFFKHFNEDIIKKKLYELQKRIILNKT